MNKTGGELEFLVNGKHAKWSPGGDSLCYQGEIEDGGEGIILHDLISGINLLLGEYSYPNFSKDGTRLLYTKLLGDTNNPNDGRLVLFILDLKTGKKKQLTY